MGETCQCAVPDASCGQMPAEALDEVASAPNANVAARMAVIRLTMSPDLPSPEELARQLAKSPTPPLPRHKGPGGGAAVPLG